MRVDLNADMGESFGPWVMGDDAAILGVVTSANVACGAHAGDPDVMDRTMRMAVEKGVGIGAHPGFADLQGFGRRRIPLSPMEAGRLVAWQVGAAVGVAGWAGAWVRHVKLHGALANMASEDEELAIRCYDAAIHAAPPDAIMLVLAGTAQQRAVERLGLPWAGEIFADRGYEDDLTLVRRGTPGAMVEDPEAAAARMVEFVARGGVVTRTGAFVEAACDSICLHGDGPTALAIARAVRAGLEAEGVTLSPFEGR